MFLLLLSLAFAAECEKMYGQKQAVGWVFYSEPMPDTVEVPSQAIDGCNVDVEILDMSGGRAIVSQAKVTAKQARLAAEAQAKAEESAILTKIDAGELLTAEETQKLLKILTKKTVR